MYKTGETHAIIAYNCNDYGQVVVLSDNTDIDSYKKLNNFAA